MKNYIVIALACVAISGCSSSEETFASKAKDRSTQFKSVASSWEKGDAMIRKGNDLVKKGRQEYEKGRSLAEKGNEHIEEGNSMIEKGQQMKMESEAQYHQLRTAPYQGVVAQ